MPRDAWRVWPTVSGDRNGRLRSAASRLATVLFPAPGTPPITITVGVLGGWPSNHSSRSATQVASYAARRRCARWCAGRRRTQCDPKGGRYRVPRVGSVDQPPDHRGRDGRGAGMGPTPRRARDPFLEQHGGWGSGETRRHSLENAQRRERMGCYVLGFQEIDQTQVAVVGGKGAHLGELSRIEGLRVPAGFCVTTDAFQRIMRSEEHTSELQSRQYLVCRLLLE